MAIFLCNRNAGHFSVEIMKFPDGMINVKIPETITSTITGIVDSKLFINDLYVTAFVSDSDDIISLMMTIDAIKRIGVNVKNIEFPYLPFARQDRVFETGHPHALKVFADMLKNAYDGPVTLIDPHSSVAEALFDNPRIVRKSEIIKANKTFFDKEGLDFSEYIFVAPDNGACKEVESLAIEMNAKGFLSFSKNRDVSTGEIVGMSANGDIRDGEKFFIIDDICDGGRTFIETAKILKTARTEDISLYVTHGLFSKGLDVFDGFIDNIFSTQSIPSKDVDISLPLGYSDSMPLGYLSITRIN